MLMAERRWLGADARAREERPGLAYKRTGGRLGVGATCPLATDGRLDVRTRRGYGAYGGWPTWPHTTSRQSAPRAFPGVFNLLKQFSN
jgi:hypothetical protein